MRRRAGSSFEDAFTHEFIRGSLPAAGRLLEVGCGTGGIAARLVADGFEVVAVDCDASAVEHARGRGVDARAAHWPEFSDGVFDAVLFTRSLHHIHPLDAAVRRAAHVLSTAGRVVVEDFALAEVDERSVRWLAAVVDRLQDRNLLGELPPRLEELRASGGSVDLWRSDHDHDLSTAAEVEASLRACFDTVEVTTAPYFFRYVVRHLTEPALANGVAGALVDEERGLVEDGSIVALGRRYVARDA